MELRQIRNRVKKAEEQFNNAPDQCNDVAWRCLQAAYKRAAHECHDIEEIRWSDLYYTNAEQM